jgi:ATP-dependent Lon protease
VASADIGDIVFSFFNSAKVTRYHDNPEFFQVDAEIIDEGGTDDKEHEALSRSVISQFEQYIKLSAKISPEILTSISSINDINKLSDTICAHLTLKTQDKFNLLEEGSIADRLERVYSYMEAEIGVLQVEKKNSHKG